MSGSARRDEAGDDVDELAGHDGLGGRTEDFAETVSTKEDELIVVGTEGAFGTGD
jgi:hypothetical protein